MLWVPSSCRLSLSGCLPVCPPPSLSRYIHRQSGTRRILTWPCSRTTCGLGKVHVWVDSACDMSGGCPDDSDCSELYGHDLTHDVLS